MTLELDQSHLSPRTMQLLDSQMMRLSNALQGVDVSADKAILRIEKENINLSNRTKHH